MSGVEARPRCPWSLGSPLEGDYNDRDCHALMQATGMVDDHLLSCWRRVDRSG